MMPGASLLLVGDRDQLPSVGPGSVLKDVIGSGLVPVVELHEVYRQARESLIVANAHRLNRGEMPITQTTRRAISFSSSATRPRTCSGRSSNWCKTAWSDASESPIRAKSRY